MLRTARQPAKHPALKKLGTRVRALREQNGLFEAVLKADRDRKAAAYFYRHGKGNQHTDVRGSLWAAYNGVTEYVDHRKPNPKANEVSQARLQYVWFGGGAAAKQRALVHALRIADPKRLETLALQGSSLS